MSDDYTYETLVNEVLFHIEEMNKTFEVAVDITLLESYSTYGKDGYEWLEELGKTRKDFGEDAMALVLGRIFENDHDT